MFASVSTFHVFFLLYYYIKFPAVLTHCYISCHQFQTAAMPATSLGARPNVNCLAQDQGCRVVGQKLSNEILAAIYQCNLWHEVDIIVQQHKVNSNRYWLFWTALVCFLRVTICIGINYHSIPYSPDLVASDDELYTGISKWFLTLVAYNHIYEFLRHWIMCWRQWWLY